MKYLILLALFFTFTAFADQRFETAGGYSHFVLDQNNDDNEVYFSNCESTIETVDGIANGGTKCKQKEVRIIPWLKYNEGIVRNQGEDDEAYILPLNGNTYPTSCEMVTSNYDTANDDWNQTEYTTNTWVAKYVASRSSEEHPFFDITYTLYCKDGVQK